MTSGRPSCGYPRVAGIIRPGGRAPHRSFRGTSQGDPVTEILLLALLSALALAGIMWTAWDIHTDLRRRKPK